MPKEKHSIKEVEASPDFPILEKQLLDHWYRSGIVEKYLHKNDQSSEKFYFQDGPITANNPMGVHHAWGRTYKDLWQRYKNMRGFRQRFQNGFDCQGLWVEVEVEKELNFHFKKDIETYGVAHFIQHCKDRVIKYSGIQTDQSKRLGYFMDWENSYFTMSDENNYMIWHFLKVCWEKGWIYKGHDSVPWCPRCETAISQHEMLTEDYKELTHKSIYLELPLVGRENEYLLIWTTTPWTLPANIAVAVDEKQDYSLVEASTGKFWVLKDLVENVFKGDYINIVKTVKGKELVGLHYRAPFDDISAVKQIALENPGKFHLVIPTDSQIMPISNTEGTGLVHTAVSAGTEDFALGKKLGLPMIPVIADNADYLPGLDWLSGQNAKKHPEIILDYLNKKEESGENTVFRIENYTHRYPACWRCKTELVWKVADEWYISMDKVDPDDKEGRTLRQKMIDVAGKITWKPEFGHDRELDWLNNMHDWLISKKNRYWGLALPIWVCEKCGQFEVVGGKDELRERAASGWDKFEGHTPHKPYIDEVKIKHGCGGNMSRIPDVGNPWLDAGIVPFSTLLDLETGKVSYTSDKKYWEQWFPADFITESFPGQFKNWFYSMIAMSTVLEDTNPFENVLGFASMLGEDGRAMHKSWGNSIEFNEAADKIGVDVMRWTFARHNPERNLLFGYKMTSETKRLFHMLLWNSYRFFANFAALENWQPEIEFEHIPTKLDLWILNRLDQTVLEVTAGLDKYDAFSAATSIEAFVSDLSTWYIRRSRDRIGPSAQDKDDKETCYRTLRTVFDCLSRVLMPFTPFMADMIYTNITGDESVHLTDWPLVTTEDIVDKKLIENMALVRRVCEMGHADRKANSIAVKQPLSKITVIGSKSALRSEPELLQLIKDELNVLEVVFREPAMESEKNIELSIELDKLLTPELIRKGQMREVIRSIQEARKNAGCRLDEVVSITLPEWPIEYEEEIKRKTLVNNISKGDTLKISRT
ncbi:isoleucine--tRNA ligase [Candidatus Collierbacteria bacterium RIFOXYB2_FULL_46_14]|uniref:Isoleucine--tRNA ligase n=1 Tax=Candidatus Collierbacteria bacterium GW2011_GWA2_46_26 TaxID=1618381 RepID=A0A0G1RUX3_9BACT|nr:MAG: Isoleucyl-tRNA synthetase [Candidatus Collierbacteria bacterium GW2011_GWC2_44_13]KKU33773.1 MAG: Isoleucyl-tRNA synthetase [Candidatus Collierbacteria bacterium GW2011_GWA2_46_26]OGD73154.1 MAG: isoleucine--tRNA ligase [Candidatus Collierbacteria bacterium RIFOXYB2_FULL_46_14]OGD76196.1 MAG: isoleucine--tRNA ligase [Candidatus Collierbacteria bacterium RIFOXYA2_FULL_46_20]OGD77532.1 MAG: isoleucine--tRNA ligase [Candidatus Collierbacteria bacterium RIFOXYC2_FULL_43_15]OGD80822.1 MAG: 